MLKYNKSCRPTHTVNGKSFLENPGGSFGETRLNDDMGDKVIWVINDDVSPGV